MAEAEKAGREDEVEKRVEAEIIENVVDEDVVVDGKDVDVADDEEKGSEEGDVEKGKVAVDEDEGETPEEDAEGETPEEDAEGETPEVIVEGETPVMTEERHRDVGKSPVIAEDEEPDSERLKDIVDLVDGPDSEDTPVKDRMVRRMTRRRSFLDEVDEPTRSRKLQFGAQGAGVETGEDVPEPEEDITEEETKRLATERKRKGKQEVRVLPKKPRKTPSAEPTEEQETIQVPFAKELDGPRADSEAEDGDESEQTEEPNYENADL